MACFRTADIGQACKLKDFFCCLVCRVVPNLLGAILPLLPLEKAAAVKKERNSAGSQSSRAGSSVKQQTQQWSMAETLTQLGRYLTTLSV